MPERQLLGSRYVIDINVAAIYLVENHPGNKYVTDLLDYAIENKIRLIIFDFLPFRVFWILTTKWGIPKVEAGRAVQSLMTIPTLDLNCLEKEDILSAFKLAKTLRHDIYDIVYIVLAKKSSADGIITTDTDFEALCSKVNLEYVNPVPKHVLKQFVQYK